MQQTKTLVKNTLIYSIGSFGSKFLTFLLIPVYSYFLTRAELGYFDLVVVTTTLVVPFISLQLSESAYRWLLELRTADVRATGRIITNSLLVIAVNLVVCILGCYLYYRLRPFPNAVLLTLFCASHCFLPYFLQLARGLQMNKLYALCGILNALILFISNVILLGVFRLGITALLVSVIAANCITIAVIVVRTGVLRMVTYRYLSPLLMRKFVRYSLPLIPNVVSWWLIDSANRYLILHYLGQDANGIYAMANRFPTLLVVVNSIFYLSWQESAILEYGSAERDAFYTRIFRRFFILEMSAVLFFIAASRPLVTGIVDTKFAEAWQYIPLLFLAVAFSSFSAFWGTGYLSSRNTKGAFTTSVFGAVVNIAISVALIPVFGLYGAALGTAAGFLATWLIRIVGTRKYFHIRLPVKEMLVFFALSLVFLALQFYISHIAGTLLMTAAAAVIAVAANRGLLVHHLLPQVRKYLKTPKHG